MNEVIRGRTRRPNASDAKCSSVWTFLSIRHAPGAFVGWGRTASAPQAPLITVAGLRRNVWR